MKPRLRLYKVYLRSKPGLYVQYEGSLEVKAWDEESALKEAFKRLKTSAFSDRSPNMWIVERIERVHLPEIKEY